MYDAGVCGGESANSNRSMSLGPAPIVNSDRAEPLPRWIRKCQALL